MAPSLLGVTGNFNVEALRAQGWDFSGRARATRNLYFDYDYALTSTALLGANQQLIEDNVTLIPYAQLARVPLTTGNVSADYLIDHKLDLRYGLYMVSAGNTKSLPAYDYSDFSAGYPLGNGILTANVYNVFNQWASIAGMIGEGVPLPLNQYASASRYTPYIGTAATERFGLPFRSIYFSYQFLLEVTEEPNADPDRTRAGRDGRCVVVAAGLGGPRALPRRVHRLAYGRLEGLGTRPFGN